MGVQTRLRADFNTGPLEHEVEAGVRLHYDSNDRFHPNVGYRMQNRQLVFDGVTIDDDPNLVGADRKVEAMALASYLMYGLRARGLTVTPGVRIEYIRTFFEDEGDPRGRVTEKPQLVALPGLGLQYAIGDAFAVLAGAYRGFSPVSPRNREMADPELSINYEAGGRYVSKSGSGYAEVIGFFNDYSNITSLCTISAGCDPDQIDRQFNGGRAFIGGVETLGGYTILLPRAFSMPLRVTYTYTNATFRTSFVSRDSLFGDVTKGDEVPYVPRHILNAQVGLEKGIWSTYLNGTYFGSMREGQVGIVDLPRTDSYFVLDVVGRIRFERVEAYIRLQNVTNTRAIVSRRPFGARPNLPFSAQVGLQVSF